MLQATSEQPLAAVESALRHAAHLRGASVHGSAHVGQHLESQPASDAVSFSICAPELYGALLAADLRTAAFLPCRIAAYTEGAGVRLAAVSPVDLCRALNRFDLAPLAAPVEALLVSIMEAAARPGATARHAVAAAHASGLGATEEQMNARAALPQRIDSRGTKLEELGGTGEHDARGG
ncbi:MAG: DUF302 domain-containing protein [Acidobacteriota bacterium]